MSKKLIVFDIDGTLYDYTNDTVPESTFQALQKLRENPDYTLVIATGRSSYNAKKVEHLFPYFDAFIFLNGLHIMKDGEDIYTYYPEKESLAKVIDSLDSLGTVYGCFTRTKEYISHIDDAVLKDFQAVSLELPEIGNIKEMDEIQQIYYFGEEEHTRILQERHPEFRIMSWHAKGGDIVPMIADKSHGIQVLMDYFGHEREHVIAFGDASNDIGMIEYVGTGVAMGNAGEELKNIADYVTKPVYDDGIMHALIELGLISEK